MTAVILEIRPGAGGEEAKIWATDLLRMYLRFAKKQGWQTKIINDGVAKISGSQVWQRLKHEAGIHRVQRIPQTERYGRIQTSTATVAVLPEISEKKVKINANDLQWQFFRSSTQGGQNVQKVNTAVRLIHKPTGIAVTCQTQRSQQQNRKTALEILYSKLWEIEKKSRKNENKKLKKAGKKASWGTQIRSYVLHPYHLVKDLRTGYETTDTQSVLDGKLEEFIKAEIYQLSQNVVY